MKITYRADQAREVRFLPAADDVASHMTTADVESVVEIFQTPLTGAYNWDYTEGRGRVEKLYELGKELNWNAEHRPRLDDPVLAHEFPNNRSVQSVQGLGPVRGDDASAEGGVRLAPPRLDSCRSSCTASRARCWWRRSSSSARRRTTPSCTRRRRRSTRRATSRCSAATCTQGRHHVSGERAT